MRGTPARNDTFGESDSGGEYANTPETVRQSPASPGLPGGLMASVRAGAAAGNFKGSPLLYNIEVRAEDGSLLASASRRYATFRSLRNRLVDRCGGFEARFPSRFGGGGNRSKSCPPFERSKREVLLEAWLNEVLDTKRASLDGSALRSVRAFVGVEAAADLGIDDRSDAPVGERLLRAENAAIAQRLDAANAARVAAEAALAALTTQRDFLLAELGAARSAPPPPAPRTRSACACCAGPRTRARPRRMIPASPRRPTLI